MTMYRGYDIEPTPAGGFTWTDERGFKHYFANALNAPYATEELAMDDIDIYRRRLREARDAKGAGE